MGPRVHNRSIFDPKISIFLRYTHITPIFGVRRIRPNGILSPPYPEVTLDNFGFPAGGRLAARRAVFQPPGRNFAILRKGHFPREVPLILDRGQRNLVGPSGPPIIWPTLINGPGPGQNYGEMAVNGRFYALPKSGKRAENPFFSKVTPKIGQKTDIYLGKGYFFLCTTLPGRG